MTQRRCASREMISMKHDVAISNTCPKRLARRGAVRSVRRTLAFTILELLVVISIIALGTSLVVPAIGRIVESNNYASSINIVTGALGSARAEAIRTGRGTAVVFLFDIETQVMTLQVCEQQGRQSGSLTSRSLPANTPRDSVFCRALRPVIGTVPIELPRGICVLGLSFSLAPEDERIEDEIPTAHWYAGEVIDEGNVDETDPWIFPRNDLRLFVDGTLDEIWQAVPANVSEAVRHANTFMIQFDESGAISTNTSAGGVWTENAFLELIDAPILKNKPSEGAKDLPFTFDPEFALEEGSPEDYTRNPEVVLRSAHQLAIVDLNRLGREVGIREPWLVRHADDTQAPMSSKVNALFTNGDPVQRVRDISEWVDLNSETLSFNRFTGQVLRRAQQ